MTESESQTPEVLREGVREGILQALGRDTERRGTRTAFRLLSAGVLGILGSVGAMLLVTSHPFDHHPAWHELIFSAVWTGMLVISLSLVLLQVRTPGVPVWHAAAVGLSALGLAGVASFFCPDPHVLDWWLETAAGSSIRSVGGLAASGFCFGLLTTFVVSVLPAACGAARIPNLGAMRALLAAAVFTLLLPGVVLESVGMGLGVLAAWLAGVGIGAYGGVAAGLYLGARLHRS